MVVFTGVFLVILSTTFKLKELLNNLPDPKQIQLTIVSD